MSTPVNQVIDNLYQAAADIEKQDRQSATHKLISIKEIVTNYIEIAKKYKNESERWQKDANDIVSKLLLQKSKIHEDSKSIEKKLQDVNANKNTIKQSLRILLQNKADYQSKKAEYERKREGAIAKKNEKLSPGKIAALVFTLGLYYIKINKDIKDAEKAIRDADDHIRQFDGEIASLTSRLENNNSEIRKYLSDIDQKKLKIRSLSFSEFNLQNQEIIAKRKTVYFTEINLFCSKVQNMLNNIDTKIIDTLDIVEQLNNETPTIESLAYSGHKRITLKQAILNFGNYIDANIPLRSFDSGLIENQSYYISNEWKGAKFLLTYVDNGTEYIYMSEERVKSGQLWEFKTRDNGKYNLTITTESGEKYLTRMSDGQLIITSGDGSKPEQYWAIEQENGCFRLYADHEPEKSLEYSFRTEGKPQFYESEDIDYQRWIFLPHISTNEQPLNVPRFSESKITFEIQAVLDSTMCLDVYGNKSENGSSVVVHDFLGGNNQKWQLLDAGKGYFYLEAQNAPGKVLDVYGNITENGAKIVIHQINNGDNQKWKISSTRANPNVFILSPKNAPNSCLDVLGGESYNGTEVILYSKKGEIENKNQLWSFNKVS
jgi:hypothetical protein